MNSVRPLVTITILVVVGAYLYVKINEGPARPVTTSGDWQSESAEGVPPLDSDGGTQTSAGDAPPWPAGQPSTSSTSERSASGPVAVIPAPAAMADAVSTADVSNPTLPMVPAIPALPDVSTSASENHPAATAAVSPAVELPANIPTAQYPDQPVPAVAQSGTAATESTVPSTLNPHQSGLGTQSATSADVLGNGGPAKAATTTESSADNPLRQANQPDSSADQYSSVYGSNAAAPGTGVPVEPTFAESWTGIQNALDEGKLPQALQLLSKWHGDPSLTPAEAEIVESLLGQLAGTVVFSTEHRLEPARIVKPGETLETIAREYNVPWQLLAKINGIPAADQLRPGQELKVVRGPFSAVIDLERKQLTLKLGDRYAGSFAITPSADASASEGEWVVQMKLTAGHLFLTSADRAKAGSNAPLVLGSNPKSLGILRERIGEDGQIESLSAAELIVSDSDADELADILSVGSRVVVRR